MKVNYQQILDKTIKKIVDEDIRPTLLLHSCCAPCSSYVLEYLSKYFEITVYFYNPNITSDYEYIKRVEEQKKFIENVERGNKIKFLEGKYNFSDFHKAVEGYENTGEGGERCFRCYNLRLEETAKKSQTLGYDYFCTVLSISPLKNSKKINEIGEFLQEKYKVNFLHSDFKKKNGYKRSVEISKDYSLYRQDYCGCLYSKKERELLNK